ncbi:MAG: NHL repeat-containing protein [Candidatus Dormibacteria bacterium]
MFGPLTVDSSGDLFAVVAQGGLHYTIREWPSGSTVAKTVAGSGSSYTGTSPGTGNALRIALPPVGDLTVGPTGSLYLTEPSIDQVISVDIKTERIRTVLTQSPEPTGLAITPAGDLIVANGHAGTVTEYAPSGMRVAIVAGGGAMGLQAGPTSGRIEARHVRLALGAPNYACLAATSSGFYILDNDVGSAILYTSYPHGLTREHSS